MCGCDFNVLAVRAAGLANLYSWFGIVDGCVWLLEMF